MNFLYTDTFMNLYFITWVILLIISVIIILKNKNEYEFLKNNYWQFLFEKWKFITFFIAVFFISAAAPFSNDHTWDLYDSILISVVTYALAPWSVGVIYLSFKRKLFDSKLFVALTTLLLPCWAYDAYIYFRDGIYPITWATNVIISTGIVITAGLFWNLSWTKENGTEFAFRLENWPYKINSPIKKMLIPMFILMFPVVYSTGWFVYNYFW
ncbi:MAG: hypothetical protein PF638_13280 [Candidatus Delongbacteria bacterium]|jgi:hypothetical protein|nr:hypothetical protein [Candidatus Delongbacteria bacterium]